jgi:branched-subunit amino acid transport protein
MRHLRYTAVAILPGLIAPLVLWPSATGGATDPARLIAAGTTLALSLMTGRIVISIFGGAIVLALMLQFA